MKIKNVRMELRDTEHGPTVFTTVAFDNGMVETYRAGWYDPAKIQGAMAAELDFESVEEFEVFVDPEELDWDEIEAEEPFAEVDGENMAELRRHKKLCELLRKIATEPNKADIEKARKNFMARERSRL